MPSRPFFGFSPAAHQEREDGGRELPPQKLLSFYFEELRLQGQKNHQEMDPFYYTSRATKKSREIQREFFFLHNNREMKVVNRQTQCSTVAFSVFTKFFH